MAATLVLKTDALAKFRGIAGLKTNAALAERMEYDAGNLSRVLAGKQVPGPIFIAKLVAAFDGLTLDDLFAVVDTDGEAA